MADKKQILIIEDEPELASIIHDYLVDADMEAKILSDGADAVGTILDQQPDLVILDIMLPGKSGTEICREVRAQSDVPIILESARVEEIDRLIGLELGADDYLCKPFSPRELVARVKAVLRRSGHGIHEQEADNARLDLDLEAWRARVDGVVIDLTRREFQLLSVLCNRPGQVFSRSQLLDLAFSDDADVFDRTIDSHIKNTRNKIKAIAPDFDPIRSVYGVGYAYEP